MHYFTDVLGSISGHATGLNLQTLTIQYIGASSPTRSTTPAGRASPATSSGALAITSHHRNYWIGLIGIGIAAVLHGLNDWNPINSHPTWVLITLISVLLFLGYARAGAWLPEQAMAAPDGMAVPAGLARARPGRRRTPAPWAAAPPAPAARPAAPARDGGRMVAARPRGPPPPPPPPRPAAKPAAAAPHAATPPNRTAPHAAAPYNPATAPTVLQRQVAGLAVVGTRTLGP